LRQEDPDMRELGAAEAREMLDSLLDAVAAGEEVVITRDGRPVARLVAAGAAVSEEKLREHRRQVIARLRDLSRGLSLGGDSIRSLIEEGRA
jgi:prevent-host-death family protein